MQAKGNLDLIPGCPPSYTLSVRLVQNIGQAKSFNAAIDQFPSGLPYPDGAQSVKNTSAQLSIARQILRTAHNRLDTFMSAGIVPEDLKQGSGS
jgi:hypothetical protein